MKSVIESFFFGILAAFFALALEVVFWIILAPENSLEHQESIKELFFSSFGIFLILSALTEELQKMIMAMKKIQPLSLGGSRTVVNSFIAGAGFCVPETILFFYGYNTNIDATYIDILRVCLLHISTFGIIGSSIIIHRKKLHLFFSVLLPLSFIHLSYNVLSTIPNNFSSQAQSGIILLLTTIALFKLLLSNKSNYSRFPNKF